MKPATDASILAAALIVSLVSLSPARALADELPKDTNQIERLTPEQAKKLAAEFPGVWVVIDPSTTYMRRSLPLNGLNSLDAETATALAAYPEGPLLLDGLTTLDAATAKTLAQLKNEALSLNGLTTLDAATAKAIAGSPAWNGDLSSIVAFESPDSVEIAATLAKRKGPLRLPNLKKLSSKTLTTLIEKEDVEIPLIETLELIQEPDGSPMDDFIIPKGFQSRQKARQQGS
jgi:hypothetical protein